jgi:hypothetical protein
VKLHRLDEEWHGRRRSWWLRFVVAAWLSWMLVVFGDGVGDFWLGTAGVIAVVVVACASFRRTQR